MLAGRVDDALGRPDPFDLVDVGAGRGDLLRGLPDVPARWRLTGVDLAAADVPFRWLSEVPAVTGLLFANEWLDAVPLDVVQDGRLVLVDEQGRESPGRGTTTRGWTGGGRSATAGRSAAPATTPGRTRCGQVERGLAVAVDYGHLRAARRPTLTGYRSGRQVAPVPDGSCDLTAHVALDSLAATTGARLLPQHEALRHLGVDAALPDPVTAAGLQRSSQARTLLDPQGLGGFSWVVQEVGLPRLLP